MIKNDDKKWRKGIGESFPQCGKRSRAKSLILKHKHKERV